ncbi:MAG: hypothetical protein Q8O00_09495 [Holophaga sp.]|nr:hypothetical protein [Holophaga sp.]
MSGATGLHWIEGGACNIECFSGDSMASLFLEGLHRRTDDNYQNATTYIANMIPGWTPPGRSEYKTEEDRATFEAAGLAAGLAVHSLLKIKGMPSETLTDMKFLKLTAAFSQLLFTCVSNTLGSEMDFSPKGFEKAAIWCLDFPYLSEEFRVQCYIETKDVFLDLLNNQGPDHRSWIEKINESIKLYLFYGTQNDAKADETIQTSLHNLARCLLEDA